MAWSFAGYTFPTECEPPFRPGMPAWVRQRKVIVQQPINADTDVLTDLGWASARRTIEGLCTAAFRDQMLSFYYNRTVGDLVDHHGEQQRAQILELEFVEVNPPPLPYRYRITFIAR